MSELGSTGLRVRLVTCAHRWIGARLPFRYGIAELTKVPHVFLLADVQIDGHCVQGIAADHLPPKWFTKDPDSDYFSDDLPQMRSAIGHAIRCALDLPSAVSLFDWWLQNEECRKETSNACGFPPLLAAFGSSLVERAVIDAFCRARRCTLHQAVRENLFGIELAAVRGELAGISMRDVVPVKPLNRILVRHTVGLDDPLGCETIESSTDPGDGLPYTLKDNITQYGLRYFKIKLSGCVERDQARLRQLIEVIDQHSKTGPRITLDGNENFDCLETFSAYWEQITGDRRIRRFLEHSLLYVEQPIHRDRALTDAAFLANSGRRPLPPLIIDESDAELSSFPEALQQGYCGTSHKNCKGVIKSLINASTVHLRNQSGAIAILSSEDLCNIGPVALPQDLAVASALGISHSERNGHHYFRGLSMFSRALQDQTVDELPALFRRGASNLTHLAIEDGQIRLDDINLAPFGVPSLPDLSDVTQWDWTSTDCDTPQFREY